MIINFMDKGLYIKDVSSQGRGVVQCGHFGFEDKREDGLQIRTSALSGVKNLDLKFIVCSHGQGMFSQCGQRGRRDQFFAILCVRFLWTALNPYSKRFFTHSMYAHVDTKTIDI